MNNTYGNIVESLGALSLARYIKFVILSILLIPIFAVLVMSTIHILNEEIKYQDSLTLVVSSYTALATGIIAFFTALLAIVALQAKNDWKASLVASYDYKYKKETYDLYKKSLRDFYDIFSNHINNYEEALEKDKEEYIVFLQLDFVKSEFSANVAKHYKASCHSLMDAMCLLGAEESKVDFQNRHDEFCKRLLEYNSLLQEILYLDNREKLKRIKKESTSLELDFRVFFKFINNDLRKDLFTR